MGLAFDKLLKDLAKKSPTLIGDEDSGKIVWCPVPSPQVTFMMGGGIPTGRMIRFRGPSSAGKSAFCNYCAGVLQQECPNLFKNPDKNKVIYVDFERTFEERFAKTVGVDISSDKFIHLLPDDIEEACDAVCEMIDTDEVAAIVFDSDGQAPSRKQMTDESAKANFGAGAKAISELLNKWIIKCANHHTTLLWITQERVNMKPMARLPSTTGGEKPMYSASIVCRITKNEDLTGPDGSIAGIKMNVRNYKNKCSVPHRSAVMNLYYSGGFNPEEEFIDFFISLNLVELKGSYFKLEYGGEQFSLQGRAKFIEWLRAHEDYFNELKAKVISSLSSHCEELDKNNVTLDEEKGDMADEDYQAEKKRFESKPESSATEALSD